MIKEHIDYQTVEGEGETDKSKSSLDVFLDDDKGKKEEKVEEKKEEKEEVKEEETEEKGEEGKKEEKEEKKDEDVELARVDYKEVDKKFPGIWKEFPTLKHAFFREQQFTEMFPTVEDGKAAIDAQAAFDEISDAVTSGNAERFISDLKEENAEGFKKFTENFLPSLAKTDRDVYLDVISPEVGRYLKSAYNIGVKENNQNLQNAAKIVRKALFGGDYEDIEKEIIDPLLKKKTPEQEKLEKDVKEHNDKKYNELYSEVSKECYSLLDSDIEKGLTDLKDRPGIKKLIAKDIREQILAELDKDGAFINRMNALWKKEARNGFSGTNRESIKTTFAAKYKAILPKIRAKARKDALGDTGEGKKEEEINRPEAGRPGSGKGPKMTPERARKENLSTKDVFDKD